MVQKWSEGQVKWRMFMGEYNHTLDAKGRTFVPAKMRDELGVVSYITVGLDGCTYLYAQEEWKRFTDRLKELPSPQEVRRLTRRFMSLASTCEMDKQGRILVPTNLREVAGIEKDVVFAGNLNKIELWSKERWDSLNETGEIAPEARKLSEDAEKLASYGLSF